MLPKLTKPSLAILSLLGLSACTTVGPDYVHPKQAPLPSDWSVEKAAKDTQQSEQQLQQWWQQFNDSTLNQLVELASKQNLDLEAAGLRIVQARSLLGISTGLQYPQEDGITALQMDIKITSITKEIMEVALDQAREGRFHILDKMSEALTSSRSDVSDHAPKVVTFTIKKDKIRDIIGPGGKIIREICDTTGARVDIDDDGTVSVSSSDQKIIDEATKWIQGIVAEPEVGVIYHGEVVKLADFGAFVNFMGSRDGLVHISELENRRVEQVSDVVKVGDKVYVKVIGVDNRGKVKLSMKVVDQKSGTELQPAAGQATN